MNSFTNDLKQIYLNHNANQRTRTLGPPPTKWTTDSDDFVETYLIRQKQIGWAKIMMIISIHFKITGIATKFQAHLPLISF